MASSEVAPQAGRSRGRGLRLPDATPSVLLVVVLVALWQLGSTQEWWSARVIPAPSDIWTVGRTEITDGPFFTDALATITAVFASIVLGLLLGTLAGVLFWRKQTLGKMFEPYLISFYTVPLVVFYPVFLVILGINLWPIIILGSIMAAIPMALNTWVGLSEVRPVYLNLGRSLCLSRWQTLRLIAMPAAAPMVLAGATMAGIYSLIGVVAMEFMIAQSGLGYRIRYRYESFANSAMYFYIIATLVISLVVVALLSLLPRLLGTSTKGRS
ncbi:ABC transporter permease subunit [Planosporangium thailandense]|uniref:ABC transporter permease subunit n=1 Tax=Planosporangium thailandense TaxID=765197 RepID=A0ABX0Y1T1_9ACTN|nr:ABC transporter permease subunit [Planosporangium thailandense]NJC71427.1 ABC transporter permease subunit [Planosporangium thailandense]